MKKSIIYCLTILIVACNNTSTDNKETETLKKENEALKEENIELKEKGSNKIHDLQDEEEPMTEEEIVLDIRKKFGDINNNINSYKKIKKDLKGESSEGGELKGYFNNEELKKIVVSYYGEMGKLIEEYYFWNNNLFFVFTQDYLYNMPKIMDGSKVEKIDENRYYFSAGKLIRWLDPNKEKAAKSKMTEKEKEILQKTNKLKEKVH